ncbi:DUF5119 domain-containing protein [Odoribacter sp. OttesenSCG-928-J03]|nr:DUF5119 domain-containing protein [Odoribacter sp. OttesenSCG-928-J03]MDL2282945.1 DUF5119 domain-containing protein [Odoribacter sp. OttesenSCG-928-G04]
MVNRLLFILFILLTTVSCRHKKLGEEISRSGDMPVKVVINWSNPAIQRSSMRINLFAQTTGIADYGRDELPADGVKYIYLKGGANYRPFCYDYNASGIYFRNEQNMETFEAYFSGMSRATYNNYASPAKNEATYSAPTGSEFYVHSWTETFDVEAESEEEQVLLFEPKNVLRHFTYRINNILGRENIKDIRGAASGMASVFIFHTGKATEVRSTMLFGNIQVKFDSERNYGYLEGEFYTFGPMEPYENWFTIELTSNSNKYFSASWDISGQVGETMENRDAKLARDGYDLLLWNNPDVGIPEIDPGEEGPGSGFEIGIGEWGDEVIIKL